MTDEELEARIAFEKDPDKWSRSERKFEERIDIMNAVFAGNMSHYNIQ